MTFKTVVVISKAGKAGKSTISKQLVAPLLNGRWIEIETFNEKGIGAAMSVSGKKMNNIAEAIAVSQSNVVLDVGISNYELFTKELAQLEDTSAAINFWVIPVQPGPAFIAEGTNTAKDLMEKIGVDAERIVFVPNAVEDPEEIESNFSGIMKIAQKTGMHFVEVPILQNPVFAVMAKREKSIIEYADEAIDWDSKITAETDADTRSALASEKVLHQRVKFLAKNLRGVWANSPMTALVEG